MKNKEVFLVSDEVLNAVINGEFVDKRFSERVRKDFKNDIRVLKNLDKVIWNVKPHKK